MDNDPGPECSTIAVIELCEGGAGMKVAQTGADGLAILEHLRHRTPYALLSAPDDAAPAVIAEVEALLSGFARAARDYGADRPLLMICGLPDWHNMIAATAAALGMDVFAPGGRRLADIALKAVGGRGDGRGLFVLPGGRETLVTADDESIYCRLPIGMDRGVYSELHMMTRGGAPLKRREGVARSLMRDEMRACVRHIDVPSPDAYCLFVCTDLAGVLPPGGMTTRQISRRIDELEQELAALGAQFGYAPTDANDGHYRTACLRRAANVLLLTAELCARLGCGSAEIVCASPMDALLEQLARGECAEDAGVDDRRALCGAQQYARRHGADTWPHVQNAALTMMDALNDAFADEERDQVRLLLRLAAVLSGCSELPDELPGIARGTYSRLSAICEACSLRSNDEVYHRLMPVGQDAGEELFAAEQEGGDEFAPADDEGIGDDEQSGADDESAGNESAQTCGFDVRQALRSPGVRGASAELRAAAILLLAQALHAVDGERISQVTARLSGRGLTVKGTLRGNAMLETLEFKYRSRLFGRVFGIKARFKPEKRK